MKRLLIAMTAVSTVLTMSAVLASPTSARPAWDTTAVHVVHEIRPTPRVVDLRVGEHPSYDRVVVDFSGKLAGYDIRYVKALHYEGSGDPVSLRGKRFIRIGITPAVAHDSSGRNVYRGPQLERYRMQMLRGAVFLGDYEGYVTFGLALSHLDTFRVLEVSDPNRLVVDVHH